MSDWERITDDTERLAVPGGWSYQRIRDDGSVATWFVQDLSPDIDDPESPTYLPPGAFAPNQNPSGDGVLPERHRPHQSTAYDATPFANKINRYGQRGSGGAPLSADGAEGRWGFGRTPQVSPSMSDAACVDVIAPHLSAEERRQYVEDAQDQLRDQGWRPGKPFKG